MIVNGERLKSLGIFHNMVTAADSFVAIPNKIGKGHGEAKLYIGSKEEMHNFFGAAGFNAKCFVLKKDLLAYMKAVKNEYYDPSQKYAKRDSLCDLWETRLQQVEALEDISFFSVHAQEQISGVRGYVKSSDSIYELMRYMALPLVSYFYIEKLGTEENPCYYWKLFVDFQAIWEKQSEPLVFTYGRNRDGNSEPPSVPSKETKLEQEFRKARVGQGKYREMLLEQCPFCPISRISDERILIASHIKPWAAATDAEKIDPYNGYILSPLYDKLFDRGFITFTKDRHLILSDFISKYNWNLMKLENDAFIQSLPMDDKRVEYLKFHHESVFKGTYDFKD